MDQDVTDTHGKAKKWERIMPSKSKVQLEAATDKRREIERKKKSKQAAGRDPDSV